MVIGYLSVKRLNYSKGRGGEDKARQYLIDKGFIWVESNFENKIGEIDLVMTDEETLVFVEAKMKVGNKFGNPEEMINKGKLWQVRRVAESYLVMRPEIAKRYQKYRIDAVCVVIDDSGRLERINHYENLY